MAGDGAAGLDIGKRPASPDERQPGGRGTVTGTTLGCLWGARREDGRNHVTVGFNRDVFTPTMSVLDYFSSF